MAAKRNETDECKVVKETKNSKKEKIGPNIKRTRLL